MVRTRTNPVKPLSGAELQAQNVDVTFLVWAVSRSTADLVDSTLGPAGLSGDEYALYSMLAASTALSPTELARWMAAPPTTVSSYIKRLETRGHIERVPNPEDKRSYRIRLTAEGNAVHASAIKLFAPLHAQVQAALGPAEPDVRNTLLALRAVLDNLRATST